MSPKSLIAETIAATAKAAQRNPPIKFSEALASNSTRPVSCKFNLVFIVFLILIISRIPSGSVARNLSGAGGSGRKPGSNIHYEKRGCKKRNHLIKKTWYHFL